MLDRILKRAATASGRITAAPRASGTTTVRVKQRHYSLKLPDHPEHKDVDSSDGFKVRSDGSDRRFYQCHTPTRR